MVHHSFWGHPNQTQPICEELCVVFYKILLWFFSMQNLTAVKSNVVPSPTEMPSEIKWSRSINQSKISSTLTLYQSTVLQVTILQTNLCYCFHSAALGGSRYSEFPSSCFIQHRCFGFGELTNFHVNHSYPLQMHLKSFKISR